MFDGVDDDDDNYFTPAANTNLASLFGTTMLPTNPKVNATLTYTAPKQPVAKVEEADNHPSTKVKYPSSVMVFKEVHAYKIVDKEISALGKCGFVLIGNDEVNIYQLLLYKEKNNILNHFKVTDKFVFLIRSNNSVCLSDEKKNSIVITFNNESDLNDFVHKLQKRKINIVKEKPKNETTKTKIRDMSENSSEKITSLNYASKNEPKEFVDSNHQSDSSCNNTKSDILSRMAKMGQKLVLPKPNVTSECSDTDEEVITIKKQSKRNKNVTASNSVSSQLATISHTNSPIITSPLPSQHFILVNGQYIPVTAAQNQQPVYMPMSSGIVQCNPTAVESSTVLNSTASNGINDQLGIFFAENRTHNSELRMSMMRITTRVEEVLSKLDASEIHRPDKLLINELQLENSKLKSTIEENEKAIASLKLEQIKLEEKNHKLLKNENELEKLADKQNREIDRYRESEKQFQNKICQLEMEIDNRKQMLKQYEEKPDNSANNLNHSNVPITKDKYLATEEILRKQMNKFYKEMCSAFLNDSKYYGTDIQKILRPAILENTSETLAVLRSPYVTTDHNIK